MTIFNRTVVGARGVCRDGDGVDPAAEPVAGFVQRDVDAGPGEAREVVGRGQAGDAATEHGDPLLLPRLLLLFFLLRGGFAALVVAGNTPCLMRVGARFFRLRARARMPFRRPWRW